MNTAHNATHTSGLSAAHKLNYVVGKIGLIPAFGDFIGKDVTKAELSLARSYVQSAAESHADLLAALEKIHANAAESPEWIRNVTAPLIARAKGQA